MRSSIPGFGPTISLSVKPISSIVGAYQGMLAAPRRGGIPPGGGGRSKVT